MSAREFGIAAKKALLDRSMTQKDLARKIGTSQRYVNFILCGERGPGKYEAPIRAALGLGNNASTL